MRVSWRDVTFIIGFGCVVCSAFIISTPLGLVTVGLPLMWLSIHQRRDAKVEQPGNGRRHV